jgi:hypothetical protein
MFTLRRWKAANYLPNGGAARDQPSALMALLHYRTYWAKVRNLWHHILADGDIKYNSCRMIRKAKPWLTVEQLKALMASA